MYKILYDFGSLSLDPLWIVLVVASLLLLALAQSYASARQMRLVPAAIMSILLLIIGDAIVYYIFISFFRDKYPADYTFPHVSIYSYGFMLMLAFVVGTIWLIVEDKKRENPVGTDTILDLMVFIIFGSIIGARVVYVLTQWGHYKGNIPEMLQITQGGLSIHGGILGAMIFSWIYIRAKKLDYWDMADFVIPGLPLGIFIGRIGCFLNGCCYGNACGKDFPLGVIYPNQATWEARGMSPDLARLYDAGQAAIGQYARHPAQLYEAFGALLIFWYLMRFRHNKVFKGHVFLMFVWLYSVLRFIVELYRFGDPETGKGSSIVLWKFITMAQLASLILGVVALIWMQDLKRRTLLAQMLAEKRGEEAPMKPAPKMEEAEEIAEEEEAEETVEEEEFVEEEELVTSGEESSKEEGNPLEGEEAAEGEEEKQQS